MKRPKCIVCRKKCEGKRRKFCSDECLRKYYNKRIQVKRTCNNKSQLRYEKQIIEKMDYIIVQLKILYS